MSRSYHLASTWSVDGQKAHDRYKKACACLVLTTEVLTSCPHHCPCARHRSLHTLCTPALGEGQGGLREGSAAHHEGERAAPPGENYGKHRRRAVPAAEGVPEDAPRQGDGETKHQYTGCRFGNHSPVVHGELSSLPLSHIYDIPTTYITPR